MARPGIMVYFDMMGPLSKLPDADKGRLFWAMLEYGKFGTVPEFSDLSMSLAWEFIKPKIDKDEAEYNMSVLRRQYATVCRERKKKGEPEITFDEWLSIRNGGGHHNAPMMTNDDQWYPTTTTTPSTTTITATSTAAARTATTTEEEGGQTAGTESQVSVVGGELGKGVVFLSDEQFNDLLDRMGLETFNHYMNKLSNYIIQNDACIKNHYETILKWWSEDGRVRK